MRSSHPAQHKGWSLQVHYSTVKRVTQVWLEVCLICLWEKLILVVNIRPSLRRPCLRVCSRVPGHSCALCLLACGGERWQNAKPCSHLWNVYSGLMQTVTDSAQGMVSQANKEKGMERERNPERNQLQKYAALWYSFTAETCKLQHSEVIEGQWCSHEGAAYAQVSESKWTQMTCKCLFCSEGFGPEHHVSCKWYNHLSCCAMANCLGVSSIWARNIMSLLDSFAFSLTWGVMGCTDSTYDKRNIDFVIS